MSGHLTRDGFGGEVEGIEHSDVPGHAVARQQPMSVGSETEGHYGLIVIHAHRPKSTRN